MRENVAVLLVDDDVVDVETVLRAFEDAGFANPMRIARNGVEALDILRGTSGQRPIERPYIILLDVNMPFMDGHQFLAEVRADPELRDSIVFFMTTSKAQEDVLRAYEKNVAGYLIKGNLGMDFEVLTGLLDKYWSAVLLPEHAGS